MTRQRHIPSEAFQRTSGEILQAVEAGVSLADAAREAGIAARTAERWLARGREDQAGPYGEFAAAVDHAREERALAVDTSRLSAAEVEELASAAARKGSVPAMRLMWQIIQSRDKAPVQADPLDELDELAARRERSAR